jgi:hypothetical protein
MGPEFSYRDKQQAAENAEGKADLFLSVQVDSGDRDMDAPAAGLHARPPGDEQRRAAPTRSCPYMALDGALRKRLREPGLRVPAALCECPRPEEAQARG